jgi:hypothetical protein
MFLSAEDDTFRYAHATMEDVKTEFDLLRWEMKEYSAGLMDELKELRREVKSMQRTMLYGFFSLGGFLLVLAGFQIS